MIGEIVGVLVSVTQNVLHAFVSSACYSMMQILLLMLVIFLHVSLLLDDANPAPDCCHSLACDKLVYVRPTQIVMGVNKTAARRRWG